MRSIGVRLKHRWASFVTFSLTPFQPFKLLDRPGCQITFRQDPDEDAHAVADKVAPQEAVPEHERGQPELSNLVYPGCVVELADFDGETEEARRRRDPPDGKAGEEEGDEKVGGQRPQRVARVLSDCPVKWRRVGPRGEPQQDNGEDQGDVCSSTPLHIAPILTGPSPRPPAQAHPSFASFFSENSIVRSATMGGRRPSLRLTS